MGQSAGMSFACRPVGFAGAGVVVPLPGGTSQARRVGLPCTVTLTFARAGTVLATKTASATWAIGPVSHNWHSNPTATVGDTFWIRATPTTGTFTSGTTGSWLQMNIDNVWTVSAPSLGSKSCTCTFEIATDSGGTNIVTSGSYIIEAFDDT
jgi:hypothetical protein